MRDQDDVQAFIASMYFDSMIKHWRKGQAIWNLVHAIIPEYCEALREGPYDPYYKDHSIGKFLIAVGTAYDNNIEEDVESK